MLWEIITNDGREEFRVNFGGLDQDMEIFGAFVEPQLVSFAKSLICYQGNRRERNFETICIFVRVGCWSLFSHAATVCASISNISAICFRVIPKNSLRSLKRSDGLREASYGHRPKNSWTRRLNRNETCRRLFSQFRRVDSLTPKVKATFVILIPLSIRIPRSVSPIVARP